jgi:lysozyme family protein
MEKDWGVAIVFVLRMEGGLTEDPSDPGGLTKYGISQKSYPNLDIRNLTEDQARDIYRRDFWNQCRCDELPSALAIGLFDAAVNMGINKAKRILQISLDIPADGIIGDKTIAAAFKATSHNVKMFLAERLAEYTRIILHNPNLLVFAVNWSHRVISLAEIVLGPEYTVSMVNKS